MGIVNIPVFIAPVITISFIQKKIPLQKFILCQ